MASPQLILASGSPRRQQFLRDLGLIFDVIVTDIDESVLPDETPTELTSRLAQSKAQAVANKLDSGLDPEHAPAIIIAADTVVADGDEILGKPVDVTEAERMLTQLRGRVHEVHSGVSVLYTETDSQQTRVNTTSVWMRDYNDEELTAYIASGDPMDKAGAYAIQHPTFAPAERVEGCISGVIGLPLGDLRELLIAVVPIFDSIPSLVPVCEHYTGFDCCQRAKKE
ncbi:MAG: Maf family protein [Chloroflexota bacterium]